MFRSLAALALALALALAAAPASAQSNSLPGSKLHAGSTAALRLQGRPIAMSLISSQTVTNVSDIRWTGLTPGSYRLLCGWVSSSSAAGQQLQLLFGTTGPTWITTAYYVGANWVPYASGASTLQASNASAAPILPVVTGTAASTIGNGTFDIQISAAAVFYAFSNFGYSNTVWGSTVGNGYNNSANITAIKIQPLSGTLASASCALYLNQI